MDKGTRIQKVLSDQGIMSRRKAEELIEAGKIKVNGRVAKLGQKINPARDLLTINDERVSFQKNSHKYYIMLHKPRGFVTTMSDELGRKCVAELVKDVPERVYPIGRLDKDSEGLLLLTNDGEFANLIMHPSHHVSKTYRVTVRPDITDAQSVKLAAGVVIDGKKTSPAHVTVLDKEPGRVVVQIVIHEGRNRQVRKMCEAVGLEVARLKRTAVGPVKLGMLAPGKWRELRPGEVGMLRNAIKTAPGAPEVLNDMEEDTASSNRPAESKGEKRQKSQEQQNSSGKKPGRYPGKEGKAFDKRPGRGADSDRPPYQGRKPYAEKSQGEEKTYRGKSQGKGYQAKKDSPKPYGKSQGERKAYGGKPQGQGNQGKKDGQKPYEGKAQGDRKVFGGKPQGNKKPFGGKSQSGQKRYGGKK